MLLGVGIGGSLGLANVLATPNGPSPLHACVNRVTGAMRYVMDLAQCSRYEQAVSWSGHGISGYEFVQTPGLVEAGTSKSIISECPDGMVVVAGGVSIPLFNNVEAVQPNLFQSHPFDENSWMIAIANVTSIDQQVYAHAICAY